MGDTPASWTKHSKGSAFSGIGTLEADILAIVWECDPQPFSVRDVYERLRKERRIAYSTVVTVMGNLHKKGLLACDESKRAFLYSAAIPGDEVAGQVLDDLVARLYRGRPQVALLHLLGLEGELSEEQFATLRAQVAVGGEQVIPGVVRDISERRSAEEALRRSKERYRILAEASPDFIFIVDRHDRVQYVNSKAAQALGRSPDELVGTLRADLFGAETAAHMGAALKGVFASGQAQQSESQLTYPAGEMWIITWLVPIKDDKGRVSEVFGVSRDITARRRAEQAAAERSHFLEELLEALPAPVFYTDLALRYVGCNEAFAQSLGRSREELIGKTVFDIHPAELARRYEAADGELLAHPERPLEYETVIPRKGAPPRYVLTHEAVYRDLSGKPAGIVGSDVDVTAIRQAEAELAAGAVQLRLTLKAAVAAIGATAEMRDPFTAGHQRRVAELACAIAVELGWQEDRIETLRTAALLHDIGTIVVPAAILSKPGKLTEPELQIVREHAAAGADTVAELDFEGAVAEMVRQHHERLDGSGYPAGLRGAEILPEACVLAVADVVEAMLSHRPYREALPIEAAMAELQDGAGSRYDAAACAACGRLFGEKGFTLPS